MANPYAPPQADLERQTINLEGQGTLQGGIDGDYDFSISDIIAEAWAKTSGAKGTFWLTYLAYGVVAVIVGTAQSFIFPDVQMLFKTGQYSAGILWNIVNTISGLPFLYPILAGITLLSIRRAVDADIEANAIFKAYTKTLPLFLMGLLIILLTMLGFVFFIIPGIYLAIAYLMSIALMMDRDMGVWEAMETSRKAITKHWFKIFFLYLIMGVVLLLASLPLLIGLIWVLPMLTIAHGLLYKKMFGVASVQAE